MQETRTGSKRHLDVLGCSIYRFLQMDVGPLKAESDASTLPAVWLCCLAACSAQTAPPFSQADECQQLEPAQSVQPRPNA